MATAGGQIEIALRLLGVLAQGETADASMAQDALQAMNQMIDSWSIERLAVYATQDQTFTWPSGQKVRTIGPTGDFVGNRPVQVMDSTYYVQPNTNISYNPRLVNEDQYNQIALKSLTSQYPIVLWVNNTNPDVTMTVYPVPSQDLSWHIISVQELSQPALLTTELVFPPGYLRAFSYNLACEIAPQYGQEPPPTVNRIAMISKRNLKRINNPDDVLAMPYALVSRRRGFNVYTGTPY